MRRGPARAALALAVVLVAGACSVGTGEGAFFGSLLVRDCGVDLPDYDLRPSFFGAEYIVDTGAPRGRQSQIVNIRVQRGSFREDFSDGLRIAVYDVNAIARERLGQPIELLPIRPGLRRPVDVTFYAQESCSAGYPDEFWRIPAIFHAVSGTITFHALHAPDIPGSNGEIHAEIRDALFVSEANPEERWARLSGYFRFFYQRGAPAQTFP